MRITEIPGFRDYTKTERHTLLRVTRSNILNLAAVFNMSVSDLDGKAHATSRHSPREFSEGDLIDDRGRRVPDPDLWHEVTPEAHA